MLSNIAWTLFAHPKSLKHQNPIADFIFSFWTLRIFQHNMSLREHPKEENTKLIVT
jgi:hypothetical protein